MVSDFTSFFENYLTLIHRRHHLLYNSSPHLNHVRIHRHHPNHRHHLGRHHHLANHHQMIFFSFLTFSFHNHHLILGLVVMDEPTNHLDLGSKETIKNMLTEFNGVSIIVSHDRDFLEGTSNLLRVLSNGQLEVYHDLERGFEALEESCWNWE